MQRQLKEMKEAKARILAAQQVNLKLFQFNCF